MFKRHDCYRASNCRRQKDHREDQNCHDPPIAGDTGFENHGSVECDEKSVAMNSVFQPGGPESLNEQSPAQCWKLTTQKRPSNKLARMDEMLIVMMGQT